MPPNSRHKRGAIYTHAATKRTGTEAGRKQGRRQQSNLKQGTRTMKLLNIFKSFKNDESGAVTVDWVVLTAAIVGLGIVVINTISPEIDATAAQIASDLETARDRN